MFYAASNVVQKSFPQVARHHFIVEDLVSNEETRQLLEIGFF
jgi:hypothetical protein